MFFQKKAAFFELEDWEKDYIKKNVKGISATFFDKPLTPENVSKVKNIEILGVFIYSKIDKNILDQLPKLKFIATMSTGFDHIDITECKLRNITVSNVPFYGENTVAEHTFALILNLSRKITESVHRTHKGDFNVDGLRGFDLKGKTLGLVGTGHIAAHVARMAHGFEMNIVGYDLTQHEELVKDFGLKYVDLNTLLKNSDIISLHLPLNDKTKYIINKKNISLIKPSTIIINTARGGLLETDALFLALQNKKIAGAGLDVLEEETIIKEEKQLLSKEFQTNYNSKTVLQDHMLLRFENVIITPHNAFNSVEALKRILDTSIENVQNYLKNNPLNIVK